MSALHPLRKGWCPGALRPMPAGDGLLVRIRLGCRRLDAARVEAIADCARCFGNGAVELSSRANLQLRGVSEAALPGLQRRLDELGLLDAEMGAESVRNIVASPLSDIDPGAVIDVGPIVAALEARLRGDFALRGLPPKFAFLIDGGGVLPLGDVEADIRFAAVESEEGPRFAVTLAGADHIAVFCAPGEVPDFAAALGGAFARVTADVEDAPRRMCDLAARRGAAAIFAAAGVAPLASAPSARRITNPADFLGAQAFGATYCVGAAAPLGRMAADDLSALAHAARRFSAVDIRLTPWRAAIVTGLDLSGAENLAAALARAGFILDPGDRRLAVAACAGAPACANAARPVQSEALEFAAALAPGRGVVLHVSGCAKGCAHARPAPFTLVARAGGYDLVVDGKASDAPSRFALSRGEIAPLLAQWGGKAH